MTLIEVSKEDVVKVVSEVVDETVVLVDGKYPFFVEPQEDGRNVILTGGYFMGVVGNWCEHDTKDVERAIRGIRVLLHRELRGNFSLSIDEWIPRKTADCEGCYWGKVQEWCEAVRAKDKTKIHKTKEEMEKFWAWAEGYAEYMKEKEVSQ